MSTSTTIILVDQAALPDEPSVSGCVKRWPARNLLDPSATVLDGGSPIAVDLTEWRRTGGGDEDFQSLLVKSTWACAVSVIETTYSFDAAIQALSRRCDAMLDEDYAVILRYVDTRILPVFINALTPNQRRTWTAFASRWLYRNRTGDWQELDLPAVACAGSFSVGEFERLILEPFQQDTLMRSAECDAVIHQLRAQNCRQLTGLTPPEQYRRIYPLTETAQSLGIDSTADIATFCRTALRHEQDPVRAAAWHASLQAMREGQQTFDVWLAASAANLDSAFL